MLWTKLALFYCSTGFINWGKNYRRIMFINMVTDFKNNCEVFKKIHFTKNI